MEDRFYHDCCTRSKNKMVNKLIEYYPTTYKIRKQGEDTNWPHPWSIGESTGFFFGRSHYKLTMSVFVAHFTAYLLMLLLLKRHSGNHVHVWSTVVQRDVYWRDGTVACQCSCFASICKSPAFLGQNWILILAHDSIGNNNSQSDGNNSNNMITVVIIKLKVKAMNSIYFNNN